MHPLCQSCSQQEWRDMFQQRTKLATKPLQVSQDDFPLHTHMEISEDAAAHTLTAGTSALSAPARAQLGHAVLFPLVKARIRGQITPAGHAMLLTTCIGSTSIDCNYQQVYMHTSACSTPAVFAQSMITLLHSTAKSDSTHKSSH